VVRWRSSERPEKGRRIMKRSVVVGVVAATVVAMVLVGGPAYAGRTSGLRFHAESQSWVSPEDGWMLGLAPCGRVTCTTVIGTTDGARTWRTLGTLNAPLGFDQATGVTEVRFADGLHGWAFEPALWATSDGGATWERQTPPGGGRQVLALGGDADAVYAVVSPCSFERLCGRAVTLWRTTPGGGSWTQVPLTLPAFSGFTEVTVAVHGPVAYLAIPTPGSNDPDVFDVTDDGQEWSARPDPCVKSDNEYLSSVAPISDTEVALVCQDDIGFGTAAKRVLRSSDTGKTTSPAGTLPLYGIVTQLAATPDGTLVASSYSIGSWIYRNGGGQTWTTSEDLGDGGIGWNDIVFTTNQVGFVIHGPAFCCGGQGPGELWQTGDGGVSWRQSEVAPRH
jgi:photosystem II stability/assembly factor-like uncharacterized protein